MESDGEHGGKHGGRDSGRDEASLDAGPRGATGSGDRPGAKPPRAPGKPKAGSGARPGPRPKPYERPRGGPARAVADLVPQIGRAAFRKFGFVQSSVVTRWPEIVGERHARACAPESIRFPPGQKSEGVLNLVVMPAHAPLIQHVLPEIMERVNRFFGYRAVARVKMRQGLVQPQHGGRRAAAANDAGPTSQAGAAPPSLRPIPLELGDSLRDVGDPELRAVLESLARSLGDKGGPDED